MSFTFDPENLANTTTNEALETSRTNIPENEYPAVIDEVNGFSGEDKDSGREYGGMDLIFSIQDPLLADELGFEELKAKMRVYFDFDDNGNLAYGVNKNVKLGQIRDAAGQNGPGEWNPTMLVGSAVKILLKHNQQGENTYENITRISAG